MMKTIHFLCGMPFSGNTLLASILQQNPRFEAAMPGGILDAIYILTKAWPQIPEFQTSPNEPGKANVMKNMLQGYYANSSRPIAFDRSRSWIAHLETAELLIGCDDQSRDRKGATGEKTKAKVIVPVRDLREILASFELLWRQNASSHQSGIEQKHYIEMQTAEGRCAIWLRPEYSVGLPYSRIEDAVHRGFADRLHFVPYEKLTTDPEKTLADLYHFLGEEPFKHDFKNIQQAGLIDDPVLDFPGVHRIRPALTPVPPRASQILGPVADRYKGPYVWSPKPEASSQKAESSNF